MNDTFLTSQAEPPPRVTIQLDSHDDGPDAPLPVKAPQRRGAGFIIGTLAVLAGLLLWSANRSGEPFVGEDAVEQQPDTESSRLDEAAGEPTTPTGFWREFTDDEVAQAPLGDLITTAVRGDDGWLALRRTVRGSRLVQSADGLIWNSWNSVDSELGSSDLFGLDRFDGSWRTMVNGAGLDEQRFTLRKQVSTNALDWRDPLDGSDQFDASGDQPSHVDLGFGNSVVVGSQPLDIDEPPSVVMVQLDGQPLERVALRPADHVASIAATPTGFVAVVVETFAGMDTEPLRLGNSAGKLVRWTAADGLVDVTDGLDSTIDLTAVLPNGLQVRENGDAVLATPSHVFRAAPPYVNWTVVLEAPIDVNADDNVTMLLGPEGSGLVFQDPFGRVWFGRIGSDWVRAPQVEGGVPRAVLLSSGTHVIAVFQLDGRSDFRLVEVPILRPADVDPHRIHSIAPFGDDWVAKIRGRDELLLSTDDGRTWVENPDVTMLKRAVSVGVANGETVALAELNMSGVGFDQVLETWIYRDGVWTPDRNRARLQIPTGRVTRSIVGDISLAVVEDRWRAPVPEVSEVLAEFVDAAIADQTCGLNRDVQSNGGTEYELVDCAGEPVGLIAPEDIEVGSKADDLLAFSQEVLRTRTVIYMSIPGREQQVVELPPSQLILDISTTEDGFVAFILDSSEVLGNVEILYSQSFAALLIKWELGDGPVTPFATPIRTPVRASAWSLNEVHANPDGSLTVISPIGIHRADPPFDTWDLLSKGPLDPPLPGRIASSAMFGDGYFMPNPQDPGSVYVTENGAEWQAVEHDGAEFRRMLIATDTFLTFDTLDRRIVRVSR